MQLLTEQERFDLTGYRRPSKQIAWLKHHGIRFFIAADGHPRVLQSDLERQPDQRLSGPDFNALSDLR